MEVAQARVEVRKQELALIEEGTRAEEIEEARGRVEEADQAWNLMVNGYRKEDIAQAEAAVRGARSALETLDRQMEELTIRAPVDGVIEAMELQPGDLVAVDAPVISMIETGKLWVRAYVPENRLGFGIGDAVGVSVDSYPGERFAARITFMARQAEFTPGNVQTPEERSKQVFRIKVTLEEGLDRLRPGMAADVWFDEAPPGP